MISFLFLPTISFSDIILYLDYFFFKKVPKLGKFLAPTSWICPVYPSALQTAPLASDWQQGIWMWAQDLGALNRVLPMSQWGMWAWLTSHRLGDHLTLIPEGAKLLSRCLGGPKPLHQLSRQDPAGLYQSPLHFLLIKFNVFIFKDLENPNTFEKPRGTIKINSTGIISFSVATQLNLPKSDSVI